ncbi:hypothetical protein, partial [Nostoc sp.]|uniref:hypothetical protein n=1 Tax=Nostoc sp. TaxID=1180 RepID=UPI002FEF7688
AWLSLFSLLLKFLIENCQTFYHTIENFCKSSLARSCQTKLEGLGWLGEKIAIALLYVVF